MKTGWLMVFACMTGMFCAAQEKTSLPLPDSGNVTLPLDEYNKLIELASKPPKPSDAAPLAYSIKHAQVKLRVENDSVHGTVELAGEVFRKGVSEVPLSSGMTIFDAHQNGKSVPLSQQNGTDAALLPGPGEFSITLDSGLPMRIDAGRASVTLPAPVAGSVELSMIVPGDHTFANVSPGLVTSRKSENGHTTIEATLVPGQPANIWWTTREIVAPVVPREVRFLSDTKTLISVSEAEMRVAVLADVTVVQGDPREFHAKLPAGYELTGVTGPTLDSSDTHDGVLTLKVNAPSQRSHQFLISMERSISDSKADAPFLTFEKAQRETGEVLVEGAGTMEINAKETGGLKRMDVKEVNPYLRSLAHFPPQAAFRYHRQPNETPALALDWVRFPDGAVLAAVAESAVVTTLVTSEGKSLTEIKLVVKNQAQPFLKVALPPGASILSAEVAGERVKPVQGPDGSRVPLLRTGFHPTDSYTVSFVFLHSGAPFAKKGGAELSLPNMDIPISLLNWEVFLPEQFKVKDFGGDVMAANRVPPAFREESSVINADAVSGLPANQVTIPAPFPGQLAGVVADQTGAVIPNTRVTVTQADRGYSMTTIADAQGRWMVANVPSGRIQIRAEAPGFRTTVRDAIYDSTQGSTYSLMLSVGSVAETVEVSGESLTIGRNYSEIPLNGKNLQQLQNAPSGAILNLQKRVAGVLPIPVDVPRAGTSFSFVRPLVLDEETKVTFSYKSR